MKGILPITEDPILNFLVESCDRWGIEFEKLGIQNKIVEQGTLRLWGRGTDHESDNVYFALPHEDYEETNANHPLLHQIQGTDNIYSIILCLDAVAGFETRQFSGTRN